MGGRLTSHDPCNLPHQNSTIGASPGSQQVPFDKIGCWFKPTWQPPAGLKIPKTWRSSRNGVWWLGVILTTYWYKSDDPPSRGSWGHEMNKNMIKACRKFNNYRKWYGDYSEAFVATYGNHLYRNVEHINFIFVAGIAMKGANCSI